MKAKCERVELTDTSKMYAIKVLTNYYQEMSTVTKVRITHVEHTVYTIHFRLVRNSKMSTRS